jgi:hypothetical protein
MGLVKHFFSGIENMTPLAGSDGNGSMNNIGLLAGSGLFFTGGIWREIKKDHDVLGSECWKLQFLQIL